MVPSLPIESLKGCAVEGVNGPNTVSGVVTCILHENDHYMIYLDGGTETLRLPEDHIIISWSGCDMQVTILWTSEYTFYNVT